MTPLPRNGQRSRGGVLVSANCVLGGMSQYAVTRCGVRPLRGRAASERLHSRARVWVYTHTTRRRRLGHTDRRPQTTRDAGCPNDGRIVPDRPYVVMPRHRVRRRGRRRNRRGEFPRGRFHFSTLSLFRRPALSSAAPGLSPPARGAMLTARTQTGSARRTVFS